MTANTYKDYVKVIREQTKEITTSKKSATEYLKKSGISGFLKNGSKKYSSKGMG